MELKREIRRRVLGYGALAILLAIAWPFRFSIIRRVARLVEKAGWAWWPTPAKVAAIHEPRVRAKYEPIAAAAGLEFPPRKLKLLAFKHEQILEVWGGEPWARLAQLPFTATSGVAGPKRQRGDGQIPEGFYRLTKLNPESLFHLSVRVDYPNAEDRAHAVTDDLGGDIYVHGSRASVGCIAIGNEAIEEVFALAHWAKERDIVISPVDFRTGAPAPVTHDPWVSALYARIAIALEAFNVERAP